MQGFKYQLEPYQGMKSRFSCPKCGQKKSFVRYIDTDGNYLSDDVGRCNSEQWCGYHKKPDGNTVVENGFTYEPVEPTFLRTNELLTERFDDNLYKFLTNKYTIGDVTSVYNKYRVRSTNKKWKNSSVFYQIDKDGEYRTGKIIQYDKKTGKRVKVPYSRIYWVHNLVQREFHLEQCLFGEHLLQDFSGGDIYLVESEKTCLICSINMPNDLFLATGGLSNLSPSKLAVLKDYNPIAIPDKGGYDYWKAKLEPLDFKVYEELENSDALEAGEDIADLLLK